MFLIYLNVEGSGRSDQDCDENLSDYFSSDHGEDCFRPMYVSVDGCKRESESRRDKQ
jgi:hypothetical protein